MAPPRSRQTRSHSLQRVEKGANRRRWRIQASAAIVAVLAIAGLAAWWNQAWLRVHVYLVTSVHPMTVKHEQALKAGDSFNECADCPEMVVVPAGGFTMGSPPGKGYDTERPQHAITIAKAFAVSKYELTFAEWDVCWAQGACRVPSTTALAAAGSR